MKEKIKQFMDTKQFHILVVSIIVFIILAIAIFSLVKYSVEGEGYLPFNLTKMRIVSEIGNVDVDDGTENVWNKVFNQNNDIYLYFNKNEKYEQIEAIKNIKIDNFIVKKKPSIGEVKIFKVDNNPEGTMFKNVDDNKVNSIEYIGEMESNVKEQKIANQGGLVLFRCSIDNIGKYTSNEGTEMKTDDVLKQLNIDNDNLKFEIIFDITIELESGKAYKANCKMNFPVDDVTRGEPKGIENTNLENIVFKRI